MKKVFVVIFVATLSVLAADTASADWSWTGYDPTDFGSDYNQIGIFWLSGDVFAIPTFTDLDSDWQNFSSANTTTTAYAFGPSTSGVGYTLNFTGSGNFSVLLYQLTLNSVVIGRGVGIFSTEEDPVGIDYPGDDAAWYEAGGGDPVAVPEPISTILFLTGGTVLAVSRLRRK